MAIRPAPAPQAPTLTDGTVTLRAARPSDAAAMVEHGRDPQMQRWTRVPSPYEPHHAEEYLRTLEEGWAQGRSFGFVIEVDGGYGGNLDLRPRDEWAAEIGYSLAPRARGRGAMTAAVRLAAGWAFGDGGFEVLHWRAHVGNWASRRVAWATGFRVEGTVRGLLRHRDGLVDAWLGSLRRGDPMRPGTPWWEPVPIRTGPFVLRARREEDIPRIVEACSDPVTRQWLPTIPHPYTAQDAAAHLLRSRTLQAEGRGMHWAVTAEDDDTMLGEVGLFARDDPGHAELGYWTHPGARGRGLTTAAVRAVARHALLPLDVGGLGMDRVILRASVQNTASNRVAAKAGFTRVGIARRAERLADGSTRDDVCYEIIADDLPPARDGRADR